VHWFLLQITGEIVGEVKAIANIKLVAEIWSHDFGRIQCIKGRQRWPSIQMPLSPYQVSMN